MYTVIVYNSIEFGGALVTTTRIAAEEMCDALEKLDVDQQFTIKVVKGSTLGELMEYIKEY